MKYLFALRLAYLLWEYIGCAFGVYRRERRHYGTSFRAALKTALWWPVLPHEGPHPRY